MERLLLLVLLRGAVMRAGADTPANCTYEDVRGAWTFSLGPGGMGKDVDCSSFSVTSMFHVKLDYPDVVTDEYGNVGFWTIIYNQGFEVVIHGRKFFAFSNYTGMGAATTCYCGETLNGWSHDLLGHDWACYRGSKGAMAPPPKPCPPSAALTKYDGGAAYKQDQWQVRLINKAQTEWTATTYAQFEGLSMDQVLGMTGGPSSHISNKPRARLASAELRGAAGKLPPLWDWRSVGGQDFVPPVRNQGGCGSCYAFSSLAMNEARLRVVSNNTLQLSFSPQDIVECSRYAQGCAGGFPYLVGGKYAEDYGLVEESCNPYTGKDGPCGTKPSCARHYSTHYEYIGGFYGACNEEAMKIALVEHGPLAVSFEVYSDFMSYHSGIYHHTGVTNGFSPFELTNHAVLLVGYGEEGGVPYWSVKNSWGEEWGEKGYFRIRRGVDECAIESIAVQSFPIF